VGVASAVEKEAAIDSFVGLVGIGLVADPSKCDVLSVGIVFAVVTSTDSVAFGWWGVGFKGLKTNRRAAAVPAKKVAIKEGRKKNNGLGFSIPLQIASRSKSWGRLSNCSDSFFIGPVIIDHDRP
jgi:hypothetical protein